MEKLGWSRRRWLGTALASATAATCGAAGALAAEVAQRSTSAPEAVLDALVRALLAFDDPRFPNVTPREIEERMSGVANLLANPAYRAGLSAFDASASAASKPFSELPLADARKTVAEWFESPVPQRRGFVSTTKTVALIALYSMPKAWPAIGYAGPFDPKYVARL